MKAALVRRSARGATIMLTPSWLERHRGKPEVLVHVSEGVTSCDISRVTTTDGEVLSFLWADRYSALISGPHGAVWYGSCTPASLFFRRLGERMVFWHRRMFGWRPVPLPSARLLAGGGPGRLPSAASRKIGDVPGMRCSDMLVPEGKPR